MKRLGRLSRLAALGVAAGLLLSAPAGAAPRVSHVDGAWAGSDASAQYVVFVVQAPSASKVKLSWPGHGGATERVRDGVSTIGFANDGASSFRVTAAACDKSGCGHAKRFAGDFGPAEPVETPGAPPVAVAGPADDPRGHLQDLIPQLPLPRLPTIPIPPLPVPVPFPPPVPQLPHVPPLLP
jgi:hypothetical protein